MINKNTKTTLGFVITLIGLAIPAAIGFSYYRDRQVDLKVDPMKEHIEVIREDVRDIRNYLLGNKYE